MTNDRAHCIVLVLGDIGRSPRMQYHALSLSRQASMAVDVVCFCETPPRQELLDDPHIALHQVPVFPFRPPRSRHVYALYALFKTLFQLLALLYLLLLRLPSPRFILVQTPPAVPALAVAYVAAVLRRAALVVDWHNYAFSLMALTLGPSHALVRLSSALEGFFGRRASAHFAVTRAMLQDLSDRWSIPTERGVVLHDCPPDFFRPTPLLQQRSLFQRLKEEGAVPTLITPRFIHSPPRPAVDAADGQAPEDNTELLATHPSTAPDRSPPSLSADRAIIFITSTSWTADERIDYFIDALVQVDAVLSSSSSSSTTTSSSKRAPRSVLGLITGKGPLQADALPRLQALNDGGLQHTKIFSVWLSAGDYPLLLGSADVGVSLHTSSSGLDLPMKVVDMFGCKLPVCAIDFKCLSELVEHGKTGLVFRNVEELTQQMLELIHDFDHGGKKLNQMRQNIALSNWDRSWATHALPVFQSYQ